MHTKNSVCVLPFRTGTLLFQIPRFMPVSAIGKKKIIAIDINVSGTVFKVMLHLTKIESLQYYLKFVALTL